MSVMEKHIYFVRHGQSEENRDRIYGGHDSPLTDEGTVQAQAVAERVGRIGVDALISSAYSRTLDTARAIGERIGLAPEANVLFGEWREPSVFAGKHRDHPEVRETLKAIHGTDDPYYQHTDEETFTEIVTRAKAAIALLEQYQAKRICVVTHAGFLRSLIGVMTFGSAFARKNFVDLINHYYLSNTGITYTRFTDAVPRWQLVTWNDQSHLG